MPPRLPRLPRLAIVRRSEHVCSLAATSASASTRIRGARPDSAAAGAAPARLCTAAGAPAADEDAGRLPTATFPAYASTSRGGAGGQQKQAGQQGQGRADNAQHAEPRAGGVRWAQQLLEEDASGSRRAGTEELTVEHAAAAASRSAGANASPTTRRPRPVPSPPRSFLYPVIDSLCEQPLPSTEPELYSFLHNIKATKPSARPDWLAWFHAQPRISPLASTRTFRVLLQYAFEDSNLRLVRALLAEMHERGVKRDERLLRVLLRGWLRHGKDDEAWEVSQALGKRGILLRSTKPRVLGDGARESRQEELEAVWKGWQMRNRDKRVREERQKAQEELWAPHRAISSQQRLRRRRSVEPSPSPVAPIPLTLPPRQPILVPRGAERLPHSDIATLVDSLVSEGRDGAAFDLADSWLQQNRPSYVAPSTTDAPSRRSQRPAPSSPVLSNLPAFGAHAAEYHATALVLLHTLLRPLFRECSTPSVARRFLVAFIDRHSAPSPARPLVPNIVTLRTLLSGLAERPNPRDARDLVDWFAYRWGLPQSGQPNSHRLWFSPSLNERSRLGLRAEDLATPPPASRDVYFCRPCERVSADVAILLLRQAVDSAAAGALVGKRQRRLIREWWDALNKDATKDERWDGHDVRLLWKKGVEVGLFESRAKARHEDFRKGGGKEKKREQFGRVLAQMHEGSQP
ncbi:hypothetical protein JCM10213_004975 [Rhodosporidiobolus nylandii]